MLKNKAISVYWLHKSTGEMKEEKKMINNKKQEEVQKVNKGLNDEELVKKYESGSIDLKNLLKSMINNPKK